MKITHGGNIFDLSRERGWDWRSIADFSASINPLGPAPGVGPAICGALERIRHYPERDAVGLRRALAGVWGVSEDQVLVGNGATELLHWFARVQRHHPVTLATPVFSEFHRAYPEALYVSVEAPAAWPSEGLLVLTQPNNPTGAALCPEALERWLLSTSNPVLIDESFLDFTGLPSCAHLLERRPQLYILRSLTKFYALPGLRIGALLASTDQIVAWVKDREPWQVNVLAEAAVLAAVADQEHGRRTLEFVATERAWLFEQLAELPGVYPSPSRANYLFAQLEFPAAPLCAHLIEHRILIRDCTATPGVRGAAVRVAVRPHAENVRLLAAWKEFSCAR